MFKQVLEIFVDQSDDKRKVSSKKSIGAVLIGASITMITAMPASVNNTIIICFSLLCGTVLLSLPYLSALIKPK